MTDQEQVQREEALKALEEYRSGQLPSSEYRSLIVQWGKARLFEARPDIERFLSNSDADIRGTALYALACWFRLQDYWTIAIQFLLYDPEYFPRNEGATALAWLKDGTRDQRTLGILASIVRDRYDNEMVRRNAYRVMQIVAFGNWHLLDDTFILERDADWDFINASLDLTLEEEWRVEALEWLEHYRTGNIAAQDYYAMLLRFGRAKVHEARAVVEDFLGSPTPLLRITAFRVLVLYLQVPDNWQMASDALQHNPDLDYRLGAASALGLLMRGTHDKATLHVLAPFAFDDDLSYVVLEAMENVYTGYFAQVNYDEIEAFLATSDTDDKAE